MFIVIYNTASKVVIGYRQHDSNPMLTAQQLWDLWPDDKSDISFAEMECPASPHMLVDRSLFDPATNTFSPNPDFVAPVPKVFPVPAEPTV
jgi:hypothetical protein